MKILMVITSHDKLGNTGRKTGFWLEERPSSAGAWSWEAHACALVGADCSALR
jgi:hypothetical protein